MEQLLTTPEETKIDKLYCVLNQLKLGKWVHYQFDDFYFQEYINIFNLNRDEVTSFLDDYYPRLKFDTEIIDDIVVIKVSERM